MTLASELKDFVMNGNVMDLAVAVVVGVAFNAVITAFVSDIITPLIGIPGHLNFSAMTYSVNGSIFMVGAFVSALISFLTIVVVIFFLVVKPVSKMKEISSKKEKKGATTKQCPECLSIIPVGARRCAFCTSKVK
ncbi:MAG: large conductance mechanosensitive channel protein MscL [Candidatus Micrarchaeaceae archaeon]|jgi:large conductance mechanosensitive channel|nr:large conductance mechanosensitive channel protein MscL [Candidatus Micrarchaeota archaeon]HII10377.1 large conductance mechanosensitive channel protein MscL [Candidatus Micrarchaeota archaeon]